MTTAAPGVSTRKDTITIMFHHYCTRVAAVDCLARLHGPQSLFLENMKTVKTRQSCIFTCHSRCVLPRDCAGYRVVISATLGHNVQSAHPHMHSTIFLIVNGLPYSVLRMQVELKHRFSARRDILLTTSCKMNNPPPLNICFETVTGCFIYATTAFLRTWINKIKTCSPRITPPAPPKT